MNEQKVFQMRVASELARMLAEKEMEANAPDRELVRTLDAISLVAELIAEKEGQDDG